MTPLLEEELVELEALLARIMPITCNETPDYAELVFGEHQTQAMTMQPNDWLALNELPRLLNTIRDLRARVEWRTIDSAPKDELILLYGFLDPHPDERELYSGLDRPTRVTGYWDTIDDAWSPMGSTCHGPWFKATHWLPLPPVPEMK